MKRLRISVWLGVLASTATLASAQLSQQDQKCINTINKGTAHVLEAQSKANSRCIRDYTSGAIPSAEDCFLGASTRVSKAQEKLVASGDRDCVSIPPFGYTNAGFAGQEASQEAVFLAHDVYSYPLETGLHLCATQPAECSCEREVSGRVEKLLLAMNKTFLKCKRAALTPGKEPFPNGAGSVAELAQCLDNPSVALSVAADVKGKIAAAVQQLRDTTAARCFTTATNEFASSVCNGFDDDPAGLSACLVDQVECYLCHLYKAVDALGGAIDCQAWSGAPSCAP